MPRPTRRAARRPALPLLVLLLVALVGLAAGCSSSDPAPAAAPIAPGSAVATAPPVGASPRPTLPPNPLAGTAGEIANVKSTVKDVAVFAAEGAPTPAGTLPNPWTYQGGNNTSAQIPRSFLVAEDKGDWLHVYTGEPPTGSMGWVKASDVDLQSVRYHLEIDVKAFTLKAYDNGKVFLEAPIAVGQGSRPTLPGLHFLNVLLKVPTDATSARYGPYAYGLSAYSSDPAVRAEFKGGQLGLHGTNDPASIGKPVSNGCIRLTNDNITKLATLPLPLGTPVVIKG